MSGAAAPQDLRLALVLNGGVSLCVWVGAVAHEMNRLVRREGVYAGLLDLTATRAQVDVISGTSAGGLNGALLALAMARGQGLEVLRDLWVEKAALGDLLRSPFESSPRSLLDGDGYFLPRLRGALTGLARGGALTSPSNVPVDLTITTTLLTGRSSARTDDFGNVISDTTHRGHFRFVRDAERDDFADPQIAETLAVAARSTASFPGAFEAVMSPAREETAQAAGRPNMTRHTGLQHDRFVVDGGVLDNKPLGPALEAISRQRPTGDQRRVLVYVVPDPEPVQPPIHDALDAPPTLAKVVLSSLVTLPRVESVSDELRGLRERNERIQQTRRARLLLTAKLEPVVLDGIAEALYPAYRERRIEAAVTYIVSEISTALAAKDGRGLGQRGRRDWLMRALSQVDLPWVPCADVRRALTTQARPDDWCWGTRPAEYASTLVLDMLRRAQRIARVCDRTSAALPALWNRAHDAREALHELRGRDRGHWRDHADPLRAALGTGAGDREAAQVLDEVTAWAAHALEAWASERVVKRRGAAEPTSPAPAATGATGPRLDPAAAESLTRARAAAELAGDLADVLLELATAVRRLEARSAGDPDLSLAAEELARHVGYFVRAEGDTRSLVLERLLRFEIVTRSSGEQGDDRDQSVDVIQVSGAGPSPLGGPERVDEKLAGVQLGHFGGFYKRSWRANDWMFGRLDAARRLVQVLLDPERLRVVCGSGPEARRQAVEAMDAVAFDAAPAGYDALFAAERAAGRAAMAQELSYLEDPRFPVPELLPACTEAVVRRLHFDIVREELDAVYHACVDDLRAGGAVDARGAAFVARYQSAVPAGGRCADATPGTVLALFRACGVGQERFEDEVGSDLFAAVASQALSVGISAGQGEASGLGPLRLILKVMRAPALGTYLFTRAMMLRSRTAAALIGAGISFAATVLALRLTGALKGPGWLVGSAGVVMGAAVLAMGLQSSVWVSRWRRRRRTR